MARMNISIPDPLYERLDRLRDRVNASKVCASALEKELDMIEGRPSLADPDIEQLVQRLQGTRERWYERGREDGKRWAVQTATREQLWHAADELEGEEGEELAHALREHYRQIRRIFGAHDFVGELEKWLRTDRVGATGTADGDEATSWTATARAGDDDDGDDDDPDEVIQRSIPTQAGVDLASYMEGWRDVVQEIWKIVAARLRR
jgi:hypothetical protein